MKLAKVLSAVGFVIMTVLIVRAIVFGDFMGEGADLIRGPWGQLSLTDVYIGFLLFSGWIIFREQSFIRSLVWIVLLLILGNAIACLYALIALWQSGGSWHAFWFGRRAEAAG
jgi:cytochrome bd-type quinol oxidase subunit 2